MINNLPDFNKVTERLRRPAKTLIIQPDGPDGDSVSTIIALGLGLEKIGHRVTMATVEEIPRSLRFLPFTGRFREKPPLKEHDLIIGVDMGEFNRTAYFEDLQQQPQAPDSKHFRFVINIDHHPAEDFGDLNLIDPSAPATTEMVYHILQALKIEIDHDMATALLTGLVTDTGCFQHANTSARAYRLAGECVRAGARMPKIMRNTYHNKNLSQLKLWGRALTRIKMNPRTKMAYSVITQKDLDECKTSLEDLEGVVSVINKVENGKFTLLLTEKDLNTLKGSLRSEEDRGIDVSKIASSLGGGGHRLSSGFTIPGRIDTDGENWTVKNSADQNLDRMIEKEFASKMRSHE